MLRNKSIFQISTLICLSSISICNLLIDLPSYNRYNVTNIYIALIHTYVHTVCYSLVVNAMIGIHSLVAYCGYSDCFGCSHYELGSDSEAVLQLANLSFFGKFLNFLIARQQALLTEYVSCCDTVATVGSSLAKTATQYFA
jgi:hypothetical protein